MIGESSGRDENTSGMDGSVAVEPFQRERGFQETVVAWIFFAHFTQFGSLFQRLLQCDAQLVGNHLRNAIDFGIAHPHGTADIPKNSPGEHRSVGDDLANAAAPVLPIDEIDDLPSAFEAEIDVDIRH